MTSWELYWLTRMDAISFLFGIIGVVTLSTSIFIAIGWAVHKADSNNDGDRLDKGGDKLRTIFFKTVWIPILFGLMTALIPTTKEMAAILILPKLTQAVSQNQELQKLPGNLLSLANEWIEHLKPEEKEKK